jgi:hypothetical protein
MGPTEGQTHGVAFGERSIAGVAVDLQRAHEAGEVAADRLALAVRRVKIDDSGRITAAPSTVIAGVGEELAGLGAAAARVEHRCRRLIGKEFV